MNTNDYEFIVIQSQQTIVRDQYGEVRRIAEEQARSRRRAKLKRAARKVSKLFHRFCSMTLEPGARRTGWERDRTGERSPET